MFKQILPLLMLFSCAVLADTMPIVDLNNQPRGDFVLHQFSPADDRTIKRSIIAYNGASRTIEYLVYAPRNMAWDDYLNLSVEQKIMMLDEDINTEPTRYVSTAKINTSYKTSKRQLYGVLKQFDNVVNKPLQARLNIKQLRRLIRASKASNKKDLYALLSLFDKLFKHKNEITLEIGELRKMLGSTVIKGAEK